jgi:hypothetical protein
MQRTIAFASRNPKRFGVVIQTFHVTAPVSHQKRPQQNATNAIEGKRKLSKINEADRYSAAHNSLVAGSSTASCRKETA